MAGKKVVIEFLGKDKSFGSTADKMGGKSDRLGARMSKVGKVAALGLAGGALIAGKALYSMGKAATEDAQSAALLARQLRNSAGATDKQVAGVERYITAMGKQLGVADDELRPAMARLVRATGDVGKAQDLAGLAMDVSAGSGKSLESVSTALAKAQNGNVGGLARLGVATKDAEGKTLSFAKIQQKLANEYVGAAATKANTLAGKMDRLKLILGETGEAIGAKLIPVVTKLADWFLKKGIPAISDFSTEVRAKLGPVIEWVRGLFGKNTDGMASDVSKNLGNIKSTFNSVVSIVKSLWDRFGSGILATIKSALSAMRTIVSGALNVIAGIFKTVAALLKGDWKGVWEGIKQIVKGAWQVIKGAVALGWAMIKGAFRAAGTAVKAIFAGMWNGIKALAKKGLDGIVSAVKALPGKLKALGTLLKNAGKGVLTAILNGLKGAGGFAADFAAQIWGAIKSAINGGISRLNSLLDFSIKVGPKTFHVNAPNIGHLAKGTDNWRGGPTWVGEKGPEILNLPRGSQVIPNHKTGGATSGAAPMPPVIVQLVVDGKTLAQSLVKFEKDKGSPIGLRLA